MILGGAGYAGRRCGYLRPPRQAGDYALQFGDDRSEAPRPFRGQLGVTGCHQLDHRLGHARTPQRLHVHGNIQNAVEDPIHRIRQEDFPSRQQLKQKNPEGIDVHQPGDRLPPHLFGRHVVWRSEDIARLGAREVFALGNSEIHQLDHARGVDVDVLRLDVTMDDSVLVNEIQSAGDLQGDLEFVAQVARMAVPDGLPQVFTLQELHDHEQALLRVGAEIVNGDHVVVGRLGGGARFGQEAVAGGGIPRCRLDQDFHRHRSSDDRVEGLVDVGHPAT